MRKIMTILFLTMTVLPFFGAVPRFPSEVTFTDGKKEGENSWNGIGSIPLTYAAARKKLNLELRRQGWKLIRDIEYDRIRWKSLEIWSRGNDRILLQYWREETALTGFSWGILKDGKGS